MFCYSKKKLLSSAVLASTILCLTPNLAQAVLLNINNSTDSGSTPDGGGGYNLHAEGITLTINDTNSIGSSNGIAVDNNHGVPNTPFASDILLFLGGSTVGGSVGTTNPIGTVALIGSGKTVNFQGNVTPGSSNLIFATGTVGSGTSSADATTTMNFSNNVTITGNIDNTVIDVSNNPVPNIGILVFQGNGTITGNVGASSSLNDIQLKGAGSLVTFGGTVNSNVHFMSAASNTTTLSLNNGASVEGKVDAYANDVGTLQFLGNGSIIGTIGATHTLNEININGAGSTVNLNGNTSLAGNLNFAANNAKVILGNGAILTANVDNLTNKSAQGILVTDNSSKITGTIGTSNSLNMLTINQSSAVTKQVELDGAIININNIYINDDGSEVLANGSTLLLNNASMVLTGNITAKTNGEDTLNISNAATINGNIGSASQALGLVKVAANGDTTINGNIYVVGANGGVSFNGNHTLSLGNNSSIFGITTTTANSQGTLTFLGNSIIRSQVGAANALSAINITPNINNSAVNLNADVYAIDTNVNNKGTLLVGSTRTVNGNLTINSGGTLALTASPLTVTNNFNLNTASTLQLDMGSNPITIDSIDVTNVATVSGTSQLILTHPAIILGGGSVKLPIISGGAGSALTPIPVITQTLLSTYSTVLNGANELDLFVTSVPLESIANQPNTFNVAQVLDEIGPTPVTGSLAAIISELSNFTDVNALNDALLTLNPIVDNGIMRTSFDNQELIFNQIENLVIYQLGIAAGDDVPMVYGAWITPLAQHAEQQNMETVAGYKENSFGIAAGIDKPLSDDATVGLALSWVHSDIHHHITPGASTDIDSFQGTLYGFYDFSVPIYFKALVGIAYNAYDGHREIIFNDLILNPHAEYHAWQYGAQGEMGYLFRCGHSSIIPIISLYYSHLDISEYTEDNADTADLAVASQDYDMLKGGVGVRFLYDFFYKGSKIQPEARIRFFYDFVGDFMQTTSEFTEVGPSFVTAGIKPKKSSINGGLGLNLLGADGSLLTMSFDVAYNDEYKTYGGFLRFHYDWL